MRALLVEDDTRLQAIIARALERIGLACDVASTIDEGDVFLEVHSYDLVVLDRRLPDGDGLSLCRSMRNRGNPTPVLFLTALDHGKAIVEGLEAGGDDYVGKPFDLEVLEARAKALLRRRIDSPPPPALATRRLRLDTWKREASIDGEPIDLTARELAILETLMRSAGGVVSRETLLERAWGEREEPMSNTIDVLVARIRKKIDRAGERSLIETLRGQGYRLRD